MVPGAPWGLSDFFEGLEYKYLHTNRHAATQSIRAVVLKNDKILMIYTNKGDYKFPGGGVKNNESAKEALRREIEEESGYKAEKVGEPIGQIVERNEDKFDKQAIFEMKSTYYLCELGENKVTQSLDDYEKEQAFQPVWVSIDEAIRSNELLLASCHKEINDWVERETTALQEIKSIVRPHNTEKGLIKRL